MTAKAVISRLQSVIFHPRPFVRTDSYFGPCRRRKDSVGYIGPERRRKTALEAPQTNRAQT